MGIPNLALLTTVSRAAPTVVLLKLILTTENKTLLMNMDSESAHSHVASCLGSFSSKQELLG